jgi:hypothetical protein
MRWVPRKALARRPRRRDANSQRARVDETLPPPGNLEESVVLARRSCSGRPAAVSLTVSFSGSSSTPRSGGGRPALLAPRYCATRLTRDPECADSGSLGRLRHSLNAPAEERGQQRQPASERVPHPRECGTADRLSYDPVTRGRRERRIHGAIAHPLACCCDRVRGGTRGEERNIGSAAAHQHQ